MLLVLAVAFTSCSDNETPQPIPPAQDSKEGVLALLINVPSTTSRAGIANGYDYEDGKPNENAIHDLYILFYNNADGLNGNADINYRVYVPEGMLDATSGNNSVMCLIPIDKVPASGDRVVVLANMGIPDGIATLADLRDYIATATWRNSGSLSATSHFAMSSAYNNDGYITHDAEIENRWNTSVTVERLAARIDLWFDDENITEEHDVLAYTTSSGNTVKITDVLPVNVNSNPTYALKHFTDQTDPDNFSRLVVNSFEYLGSNNLPANYVVEPATTAKNDGTADLDALYGNSRADYIRTNYAELFGTPTSLKTFLADNALYTATPGDSHSTALIISYANENTQHKDASDSRHITGLVLKASYIPKSVLGADGSAHEYAEGSDIVRCRVFSTDQVDEYLFDSEEALQAWLAANPGQTYISETYPGGVCYYNIWLRHRLDAQTGPSTTFRMKYATVRNHIYRIAFNFSGIGTPEPTVTEPENVSAIIFVRQWNFRRLDTIIM